ncbi:protein YgfX [Methylophaga sp. OBS4]|uniref:protein YgfX n=1 Tax=Methylophaga sp. OBS4 TaxID=2991935 RepID=UPI00225A62C9|nr:protein YgfX [Methylophaga sp. OBS4]MCX4186433.1 hypothetical protein [Methylophaga sp. OBS4]
MKVSIGRSFLILCYLCTAHGCAVLLVIAVALPVIVQSLLCLLLLLSLFYYCRQFQWQAGGKSITALECNQDNQWYVICSNQSKQGPCTLMGSVVMAQWLIVHLQQRRDGRKLAVVIATDAADKEKLRQLRIKLRDPATWAQ